MKTRRPRTGLAVGGHIGDALHPRSLQPRRVSSADAAVDRQPGHWGAVARTARQGGRLARAGGALLGLSLYTYSAARFYPILFAVFFPFEWLLSRRAPPLHSVPIFDGWQWLPWSPSPSSLPWACTWRPRPIWPPNAPTMSRSSTPPGIRAGRWRRCSTAPGATSRASLAGSRGSALEHPRSTVARCADDSPLPAGRGCRHLALAAPGLPLLAFVAGHPLPAGHLELRPGAHLPPRAGSDSGGGHAGSRRRVDRWQALVRRLPRLSLKMKGVVVPLSIVLLVSGSITAMTISSAGGHRGMPTWPLSPTGWTWSTK